MRTLWTNFRRLAWAGLGLAASLLLGSAARADPGGSGGLYDRLGLTQIAGDIRRSKTALYAYAVSARPAASGQVQLGRPGLWLAGVSAIVLIILMGLLILWLRKNPRLDGALRISVAYPYRELEVKDLNGQGWRASFNPRTLRRVPGVGRIRARYAPDSREAPRQLEIMYWPANASGRAHTVIVNENGYHIVNGLRFDWVRQR